MPSIEQHALTTLKDFKDYLRGDLGSHVEDSTLERFIMRATAAIEEFVGRELIFRGTIAEWNAGTDVGSGLTEFHTIEDNRHFIYTLQFPINVVSLFAQDSSGQFSPGEVFVLDTNFRVDKPLGKLTHISGGGVSAVRFFNGIDVLKVIMSAGFLNTATKSNVPADIVEACLEVATLMFRESDRRKQGIKSESTASPSGGTSTTRFDRFKLPDDVKDLLSPHKRFSMGDLTGRAA